MANSWQSFQFVLEASRFFSNTRKDILGNLIRYENLFAAGASEAEIIALSQADATAYKRPLDAVKVRWDSPQQQTIKDFLTSLGFSLTDVIDEYQALKSAADLQLAATTLGQLNTAATTIRGSLPDFGPLN